MFRQIESGQKVKSNHSCSVLVFVLFEKLRNIFIGYIHKSWSGYFVDKIAKQFFPPNLTQPDWSNQIITVYLIGQFKPWSDMISFHCMAVKWYHITSRISFLVTTLSHWYPHIICKRGLYGVGFTNCCYNRRIQWRFHAINFIHFIRNRLRQS